MGVNKIAGLWGFAEATLFFIVPDVWLSIVGRNKLKAGIIACFYSLIGALLGGTVLYGWGAYDLDSATAIISYIPAISTNMLQQVNTALATEGLSAILMGPLSGTPYKTYAIFAAHNNIGFGWFLLITIPARLMRFLLVTLTVHYIAKALTKALPINKLTLIIFGWSLFYVGYFYAMIN